MQTVVGTGYMYVYYVYLEIIVSLVCLTAPFFITIFLLIINSGQFEIVTSLLTRSQNDTAHQSSRR